MSTYNNSFLSILTALIKHVILNDACNKTTNECKWISLIKLGESTPKTCFFKGPKHRFPSNIDFPKCRREIAASLNDFVGVNEKMLNLMP